MVKRMGHKKGNIANLQAYLVNATTEVGKNLILKFKNADAQKHMKMERILLYSKRIFKMSCATCHVQGAGQRVRNEKLSPLTGQITQFPVFRLNGIV